MWLNNVTKFHKILIKNIRLRERTSLQMVNFRKQRAITTEGIVRYPPVSKKKKTSWYLTMWPSFIKFWSKVFDSESGHGFKWWFFINKGPYNYWKHGVIWTIIQLEENIIILNNLTMFHKILIKNIRLRERTSFQMVNFHKQRAITTERMVQYGPLSNLKKTSCYLTMWPNFIKFWSKVFYLKSRRRMTDVRTYEPLDGRTDVTLNAPAIVMAKA